MAKQPIRPGSPAPASGQYKPVGPRGGSYPEVTAVKGKTMPPGPVPGATFKLVDGTKNKSDRP